MVAYWGIRLGEGGKYVGEGLSKNFIAVGWDDLGDLTWLLQIESEQTALTKLKEKYKHIYGNVKNSKVGIECGELFRFVRTINKDDILFLPNPSEKTIIVGRITSDYQWKESWNDKCPYRNRRSVSWIKTIPRQELSPKLKHSLVWLTVISLEEHASEVESLTTGEKPTPKAKSAPLTGKDLSAKLIARLLELDARSFEEFIAHLLSVSGFESANRQHVGDKGIDIDGIFTTELVSLSLKVQVKRISGSLGNKEVLQLRGALGTDEHGVIVTTGTFTKQAIEEAESQGKKYINLVDRDDLVDLVLTHYDELDNRYKDLLNLKKKDIPLPDQFYLM